MGEQVKGLKLSHNNVSRTKRSGMAELCPKQLTRVKMSFASFAEIGLQAVSFLFTKIAEEMASSHTMAELKRAVRKVLSWSVDK